MQQIDFFLFFASIQITNKVKFTKDIKCLLIIACLYFDKPGVAEKFLTCHTSQNLTKMNKQQKHFSKCFLIRPNFFHTHHLFKNNSNQVIQFLNSNSRGNIFSVNLKKRLYIYWKSKNQCKGLIKELPQNKAKKVMWKGYVVAEWYICIQRHKNINNFINSDNY